MASQKQIDKAIRKVQKEFNDPAFQKALAKVLDDVDPKPVKKKSKYLYNKQPVADPEPIEPSDYLMWVGSIYYPTVGSYVSEAMARGACKRLGHLPSNFVPGKSRIFLAHDDGMVGDGFVFGYFIPNRVEYLAHDEMDIPIEVVDQVIWIDEWNTEEERECGFRREGMYAVSYTMDGERNDFVTFDRPRILELFDEGRTHFRGLLEITYGNALINAKRNQTMVPPSVKYSHLKKREVDDDELVERMLNGPSLSRIAQEIAFETGAKKSSVIYRFNRLIGKVVLKRDEPDIIDSLRDPETRSAEMFEHAIELKRKREQKRNPDGKVLRPGRLFKGMTR